MESHQPFLKAFVWRTNPPVTSVSEGMEQMALLFAYSVLGAVFMDILAATLLSKVEGSHIAVSKGC